MFLAACVIMLRCTLKCLPHRRHLIYMSIINAIQILHAGGDLVPFHPTGTRRAARRRAYLTKEAAADFNNPQSAINLLCGPAPVAAALTLWVLGDRIYGDCQGGRFLTMLHPPPPDIWEIRVTEPNVQVRMFCRFAEADTVIVTRLHTRDFLGRKGSAAWGNAMTECKQKWDSLFPGMPVFSRQSIHQYVTEECDDFPLLKLGATRRPRSRKIRGH